MNLLRIPICILVHVLVFLPTGIAEAQGMKTVTVPGFVRKPQEMSNWCWAACLQSLFLSSGVPIDQSDIVKAAYGEATNLAAPGIESIVTLLNNVIVDVKGERWKVRAYARHTYPNGRWLFDELNMGDAVMVWFRDPVLNHAIVLDGGTYYTNRRGEFVKWRNLRGFDPLYNKDLPIPAGSIPRFVYSTFYVKIERAE